MDNEQTPPPPILPYTSECYHDLHSLNNMFITADKIRPLRFFFLFFVNLNFFAAQHPFRAFIQWGWGNEIITSDITGAWDVPKQNLVHDGLIGNRD